MSMVELDTFLDDVRAVARDVAAPAAVAVDAEARFPHEAIDALRECGALGAFVPASHGGAGLPLEVIGQACFELARGCSAVGMVFAMHQIQVASLVGFGVGHAFFDAYLRDLVSEQRLIASVTSEVGVGGDLRRTIAPLSQVDGAMHLEKQAPTVSYGVHADDLLITARRSAEADEADQVLELARSDQSTLEQTSSWDPLGMRGTCSPGFKLIAEIAPDQVVPVAFAEIAPRSMVPCSHLFWGHVWLGIANEAFERAAGFVRGQARSRPGWTPPTAQPLSQLASTLQAMRATLAAATAEYQAMLLEGASTDAATTFAYAIRINSVKVTMSERAAEVCFGALRITGMAGYKNDTPFSIGRQLRDSLSAALMIGNERILATNATLLLVQKST